MLRQTSMAILVGLCVASTVWPADARVVQARVITRTARVATLHTSIRPDIKYAGTVSTQQGFTGEVEAATFDTANGNFYLVEGAFLFELMPDGQTTQVTNFLAFGVPAGIVWDANTQSFYLTDDYDILAVTQDGTVTVLAGAGFPGTQDGQGSNARFQGPSGLSIDPVNHYLYVGDHDRLRRVDESGNVVTVGPTGVLGSFFSGSSFAIAFDTRSGDVAVADAAQDVIHLFTPSSATYRTLAGACIPIGDSPGCVALHADGSGLHGLFADPMGIAYNDSTNAFYLTDFLNYDVRRADGRGNVTTTAGNGTSAIFDGIGLNAEFFGPTCIALDPVSHTLMVCDGFGGTLRIVTTQGHAPPLPSNALALVQTPSALSNPTGIAKSPDGSLWFSENASSFLGRRFTSGKITEYPLPGGYGHPYGAAADSLGRVWFGDYTGLNGFGQGAQGYIARAGVNGAVVETVFPNHCSFGASSASLFTPDANGGAWFADSCPSAVGYEDTHRRISQFLTPGASGLVLGNGFIWVGQYNQLQQYALNGVLLTTYTGVTADSGIVESSDGHIWYLSNSNEAVGDFDPVSGTTTVYLLPSCGCSRNLGDLTIGSDGAFWFTEGPRFGTSYPGGLGRLTIDGVYTEYHTYEPRSQPSGATLDSTGRLWFADFGANKLGYVP